MPSPLRKLFEKTFKPLCVALVLVLATTTHSTLAAIRQSSDKIVDRSVENVLEAMPYAGLGLPSRLTHPNDCYVIVTAGAAYTDIKVLASPWESAPRLAERVNEALRGTPYAKDEAVWSADTYAAVQVLDAHGRFGTHSQTSSVAYGAIMDGMRRAGFTPHVLVRVPRYASTTGLPHAPYRTKNYRWYGEAQLRGGASFGVRADLNPISLVKICLVPSLVIVIGLVSLVIAVKVARSGRGKAARRSLITTVVAAPLASAFVGMFSILVMARDLLIVSDLWLGKGSFSDLWGLIMITTIGSAVVILYIGIALLNKLLGKAETVLQKIALSPEEEAIHRKMSKWQTIPHLVGGIGFLAALFLVPRTSPYYPYIHPLTMAAPALIGLLVASIYRKPLAKFTKKTVDPDLTWFARDIGKQVGFRVQDVYVVESSRAAQVAEFSMEQGNNIIVTQKFKEIMTPQEAGFLLTSRLIQQRTNNQKSPGLVFIVPLLVIAIVLLSGGVLHSMSPTALLGVFARVVPISIASTSTLVILSILNTKRMQGTVTKKAIEADQQALAIQGGAIAARMALAKMMMHSPYRDPASAAQTANPLFTYPQRLAALKEYENSEVLRS